MLLNYLKCMLAFFIAFINFEVAKKKRINFQLTQFIFWKENLKLKKRKF